MSSKLTSASGSARTPAQDDGVSTAELLELLGDEYTRHVLRAVVEQPRGGTAVAEAADVSKATAYRRLDALEEAGLVVSETVFNPEGHHHERYRAVVEEIELRFEASELTATVEVEDDGTDPQFPAPGRGTDDD
jgi:DNA-binding transcriptional ArsR family regulator